MLDVAGNKRKYVTSEGGERVQERKLRRREERILALYGDVGDEDRRADGVGKIFDAGRRCEHRGAHADHRLPGKGKNHCGLQKAADPKAQRQRQGTGDESAGEAAEQSGNEAKAIADRRKLLKRKSKSEQEIC